MKNWFILSAWDFVTICHKELLSLCIPGCSLWCQNHRTLVYIITRLFSSRILGYSISFSLVPLTNFLSLPYYLNNNACPWSYKMLSFAALCIGQSTSPVMSWGQPGVREEMDRQFALGKMKTTEAEPCRRADDTRRTGNPWELACRCKEMVRWS